MHEGKIVVARIFDEYDGRITSRAGVITRLDHEKFETICIYLVRSSDKECYFEAMGYKVFYLSNKSIHSLSPGSIYRLSKFLKANKVDIVHCNRHKATVIGTLAAMLAGTPVTISQVHGLGRTRNFNRKLLNYFLFKRITKIITVGEATRQDVLKSNPSLTPDRVVNEGNSIEYERFANSTMSRNQARAVLSLSPEAFVYGTVGRLVPTKGPGYLIKAFEIVKSAVPAAQLIFVGDGRLKGELESQAAKTAVADSIRFLGKRSDVPEILRAMDIFVLPSVAEGMPRVLLEAMAAGVPSIATNVGAIPEIIDDGQFGFLISPENEISLADAMIKIARLPQQQREEMITAARKKIVSNFTHEIIARRLEKLYEEEFIKQQPL